MRDVPSRGRCHAAFLLAYSARVRRCEDANSWLAAALDKPTHMAASLDLAGTAHILLDVGLAWFDNMVVIAGDLARLDRVADITTLKAIARLLLVRRPPDWLRAAVTDGKLVAEFIPGADLEALSWLGSDLEAIVVEAHRHLYGALDDEFLKRLGNVGELAVISALQALGRQPRHVALVSDHFGYDIEVDFEGRRHGLEVKTVVLSTAERVILTRNEFDVAARMGNRWRIIQVTLSSKVIPRGVVNADDVIQLRELSTEALSIMAPPKSEIFRWTVSAEFRPLPSMWAASNLAIPRSFSCKLLEP